MASQELPEGKGNTLFFLLHAKKVILKKWIAEYLEKEPLKLKWEMQYDGLKPEPNLLLESKSEPFQLNQLEAENVDTVYLVTQTLNLDDKVVLDDKISLKLELIIGNSPNVVVGRAVYKLNILRIRSQISPFSFELKNENDAFIGYVDVLYVSQQRWVKMHKNSLPMNRAQTPETNDSTARSDYFTDDSPYSATSDGSEDDYVMIFWNSTNTCFVRNHPNDVQLQELRAFVSSSLKNGDLNATLHNGHYVESADEKETKGVGIKRDREGAQKELTPSLFKPLTYKDAKTLIRTESTPCEVSSSNINSQQSGDSSVSSITIDEIQHSSRLYSSSLPSVERFLNKPVFDDPTSFYNYISRQNKHFQNILSKLSPSCKDAPSGRSAISDREKPRFTSKLIKHTQSTIDTMSSFNNLGGYSGPSIDTVTTDLVSLENKSSCNAIDDLTIGDTTITTTKTMFSNTTFNDKDSPRPFKEQSSTRALGLSSSVGPFNGQGSGAYERDSGLTGKLFDIYENVTKEAQTDAPKELVTPMCENSVTVYSLFSPVSHIEDDPLHEDVPLYDARSSQGSASLLDEPIELPLKLDNLRGIDALYYKGVMSLDSARMDHIQRDILQKSAESIRNYFRQPQNAYYISDQDIEYSEDYHGPDNGSLLCEHSILDFQMVLKDVNTLSSTSKPPIIRCSQETINNALEDAKLLKSQREILPKAAIIKIFLKYLNFYASEMVPVVVHLETITQKQLQTIKRTTNNIDHVLKYIDVALSLLLCELNEHSMDARIDALPFEFMKDQTSSDMYNFFIYDTQTTDTEIEDIEIDAPATDKNLLVQNVITTMYSQVDSIGSSRLVYVSKMHTVQTKSRGCFIRFAAIKLAFYRTFCGRRKIAIGHGQVLKV